MKKKMTEEQINELLTEVLNIFSKLEDFDTLAISISAVAGNSMMRKRYINNNSSGMMLEHVMQKELKRIQEDNEQIYS